METPMQHFLCVVHVDRERAAAMTPAERAAFEKENQAYADWLVASGHSMVAASLHEPETASLLRTRDGQTVMTDGPYVETKEHLAGFIVLKVEDREAALEIIKGCPVTRVGTLELRRMNYGG
jgi:hypothetical protein